MLKIYLARHGQDEDNAKSILNGQRDTPLTSVGVGQARELADHILESRIELDTVYCSPLLRAYMTAQIVTDTLDLGKPIILDNMIERDFGTLTGHPISEIDKLPKDQLIKMNDVLYFLNPEGGETFPQVLERAKKVLAFILEHHKEGSVLLVAHGEFLQMFYANYYNLDWREALTAYYFGNAELTLLSEDTKPEDAKVFSIKQYNN
jgi:broad specificity phosphatase PhoE